MTGTWLVDRVVGFNQTVREEFDTHMAAAEFLASVLAADRSARVVCWHLEDHVGPWVEPLGVAS